MTIYAKTLNPEDYDYRIYDISNNDGNEVAIEGGRDFQDIDQKGYLKAIRKLIRDYGCWDYETYYNNSIMAFLRDYLPKKENGKRLSPKEANKILVSLDLDRNEEVIATCLSVITGKAHTWSGIRGCCQGDYATAYYPVTTPTSYIDYVEAWYFGTGTEVEVSEEDANSPEEVSGWTFYTANWKTEDLKREIKEYCGYKGDDDNVEVILWLYDKTRTIHIDEYKLAD